MNKKLEVLLCSLKEAQLLASIDRSVLEYLPTDIKYSAEMEDILFKEYGYGFLEPNVEEKYNIPDYISEEEVTVLEAEAFLYHLENGSYPQYKKKKRNN